MATDAIRDTIALAKLHEQQTDHLAKLLDQHVKNDIHFTIQLPEQDATASLVDFIIAYIEHVPRFIDATRSITSEANIREYAEPFLKLAEDFFLKPPEIVSQHVGLNELMDEAYLAHRLIEEVNDRFMIRTSIPLVPMDMTMSNLIVHSIIGEPFANELDEAVHYMAERNMLKEHVYETPEFKAYVALHQDNHWEKEQQHWPCLTDELSINLQFAHL
ncbi:MAG: hypothetical protein GY712_00720 [Oceanicoccus sp.]|uniref:hypothetical protein n=1 Tax=Oceanicoccus sp. TaxID=2691044 RepID=UPI00261881CE|nr:hypothetical protein [Oceanicoccus sp.]MCP3906529.1 hypothetical protein [Oceanicoccus sp.]MDG1773398.1 hypothetical protein [Oceanicoccus sp.]